MLDFPTPLCADLLEMLTVRGLSFAISAISRFNFHERRHQDLGVGRRQLERFAQASGTRRSLHRVGSMFEAEQRTVD
jgi:hypothetical protein